MKYTDSHEWINLENQDNVATVGVSSYAQKELGEIVYVELPKVGQTVKMGEEAAVLESTKAAADVYSPLSGTIVEVNQQLRASADLINQSPEKEGWIFKIAISNPTELEPLMDPSTYLEKIR